MARRSWALAFALLCACGDLGDGSLPDVPPPPEETPKDPDKPANPDVTPIPPPPTVAKSNWPLTTGSSWTYRITDPLKGIFEKRVEVLGPTEVGGVAVIKLRSVQPHLEEISYQFESQGLVMRVREEDLKAGALVRVMTWTPPTLKAVSGDVPEGWTYSRTVHEVERDGAGTILSEKDKVFSWRLLSRSAEVVTPAGTFTAIKLERERSDKDTDIARIYWLVPGIGKVREEGERTEELVSSDVKPAPAP